MDPNSPWYEWHPDSIGWLKRRARDGEEIRSADVGRVLELAPEAIPDPAVRDLVIRACSGELRPRRGRPCNPNRGSRLMTALWLSDELVKRYSERKRRWKREGVTRPRGDLSPTDRAHAVVARILRYSSLEVLRNELCSYKKELINLRARRRVHDNCRASCNNGGNV